MISEREISEIRGLEAKKIPQDEFISRHRKTITEFITEWYVADSFSGVPRRTKSITDSAFEKQVWAEFFGIVFSKELADQLKENNLDIAGAIEAICREVSLLLSLENQGEPSAKDWVSQIRETENWLILKNKYAENIRRKSMAALKVYALPADDFCEEIIEGVLLTISNFHKVIKKNKLLGLVLSDGDARFSEKSLFTYVATQLDLIRFRARDEHIIRTVTGWIAKGLKTRIATRIDKEREDSFFTNEHRSLLLGEVYIRVNNAVNKEDFYLYAHFDTFINGIVNNTLEEFCREETTHLKKHLPFLEKDHESDPLEEDPDALTDSRVPEKTGAATPMAGIHNADNPPELEALIAEVEENLPRNVFSALYREASRSVPRNQLALFVLRHTSKKTSEELARELGISAGTLNSRVNRAKNALWREICKVAARPRVNVYLKKCHEKP